MTRNETALGEGLKRWSIETGSAAYTAACEAYRKAEGDEARFYKAFWEKLATDGDARVAALRPFFERAREDMQGSSEAGFIFGAEKAGLALPASGDAAHEMSGAGLAASADKADVDLPSARQQNGGEAGSMSRASDGSDSASRPSPTSRGAGANAAVPKGTTTVSPAREQSEASRKGSLAAWKSAAAAVNRQFKWLDTLYERHSRKPLVAMTYGELKTLVNGQRRDVQYHVKNACTSAHVAIVARKLMDECDAQGVVPDEARWAELLPQDRIRRFEEVWTKEKITKEFIRYLADSDERTLEVFLSKPELAQIDA